MVHNRYAHVQCTSLFFPQKLGGGKCSLYTAKHGNKFQDLQWMPETIDTTEPHICYVLSYTYIHLTVSLWHVRIVSITTLAFWRHY